MCPTSFAVLFVRCLFEVVDLSSSASVFSTVVSFIAREIGHAKPVMLNLFLWVSLCCWERVRGVRGKAINSGRV